MNFKEKLTSRYSDLSFYSRLNDENASFFSRRGDILLTTIVILFIFAVAFADSQVRSISLGYLYVLPIALSGLVNSFRINFVFIIVCVVLHDLFGIEEILLTRMALNLIAFVGLFAVVIIVNRISKERLALSEIIRRHHIDLEREIKFAAEVQHRLLPTSLPNLFGLDVASYIIYNREVGGDYYDFIETDTNELGFSIADVSGKGISASILMPTIEVALRLNAIDDMKTLPDFNNLNQVIFDITEDSKFITLFFGKLNIAEKSLEYLNAGHNPPLLFRQNESKSKWLDEGSFPIGLFPDTKYKTTTIGIEKGDVLVCYTDGLSEAEDATGEQFSKEEIARITKQNASKSAQGITDAIINKMNNFRGQTKLNDDLTLIVLKINLS